MGLYDILKASKLGAGAAPDMYTALFAQKINKGGSGGEAELSGVPPLTFPADGTPLIDYLISGNMIQSGTPAHESPVMPQGTGKRTAQLFDENYPNIKVDTPTYRSIYVGDGTFTLSTTTVQYRGSADLFFLAGNVGSGASTQNNGVWNGNPRTVTAVDGYVTIAYRYYISDETSDPRRNDVMLNAGDTALPHEPWGVKIPISSADTTTSIYLGEVESTRRIKKLVLTGEENWEQVTAGDNTYIRLDIGVLNTYIGDTIVCTHCGYANISSSTSGYGCDILNSVGSDRDFLCFRLQGYQGNTIFKQYLEAQYTAGTPVTVWYVLAEPETGVVNEPLCKIGDYADTLSMEQAGAQIPTNNGTTVIDVDSTLKPSEVYIKYHTR